MGMTILVTGASTGIGAAICRDLAQENRVLVHYNKSARQAKDVAEEVTRNGGSAEVFQADLTEEEGCRSLVKMVKEATDHLDLLVNNAGGLVARQNVWELEWSMMQYIFALNTFSTMLITSELVPLLRKGSHPLIVNMTSVAMHTGSPTATLYAASKGAIDTFTRGAAKALAPDIRVNAIAPGVIATPFHDKYTPEDTLAAFKKATPVGEFADATEIARTVRFLIEARFMTGATIDINGGMYMR